MKKIGSLLAIMFVIIISVKAQPVLADDQNPNYKQSQDKYMKLKDSILANENTTAQQTYKAYDWYQAKLDRRNERRAFRREIRLANACNYNNYDYGYSYGFNNYSFPYYNNYNNYYNRNTWGILPTIGYRTGNWIFWYH